MLTLLQCRKLGRVYTCLQFTETTIQLRNKKVVQVRVKDYHPFQGDIFNSDGTLDRKELERVALRSAQASALFEEEYYEDDVYDDATSGLIKEGEIITDPYQIMDLDDVRYMSNRDWFTITDEEIEELYNQANF